MATELYSACHVCAWRGKGCWCRMVLNVGVMLQRSCTLAASHALLQATPCARPCMTHACYCRHTHAHKHTRVCICTCTHAHTHTHTPTPTRTHTQCTRTRRITADLARELRSLRQQHEVTRADLGRLAAICMVMGLGMQRMKAARERIRDAGCQTAEALSSEWAAFMQVRATGTGQYVWMR